MLKRNFLRSEFTFPAIHSPLVFYFFKPIHVVICTFFQDMYFEFDKVRCQNWIVEGDYDNQFYYHFNFSATQACSTTCLFFAEAIPNDGDSFDTSCKLLTDGDNGMFIIISN
jgi:hypothetical protein